jgi:hypothetical protein
MLALGTRQVVYLSKNKSRETRPSALAFLYSRVATEWQVMNIPPTANKIALQHLENTKVGIREGPHAMRTTANTALKVAVQVDEANEFLLDHRRGNGFANRFQTTRVFRTPILSAAKSASSATPSTITSTAPLSYRSSSMANRSGVDSPGAR